MNNDTAASLATLLIVGVTITIALLIMTAPAPGSQVCLTKKEARQLWPRRHIYWYSSDHCWSNRRGGPPRGIKIDPVPDDPVFPKHSMAQAPEEDHCCWP